MDPGIPRPGDFEPGDPLSADALNAWAEHVSGSRMRPGGGLQSAHGASGSMMRLAPSRRPIMALLSGSSSPYSWTQKLCTAAGTLATGPLSGTNAHETNATASLGGNVVRLFPDGMGGWWFTSKCCTASCTGNLTVNVKCGGVNVVSASVTITQGATSYTGSTNASGNVTFTPGISGTWDITVTKSGITTYNSTFSWSCTTTTLNVVMSSSSNVVSGNVKGCNSANLSGVAITLKQGATTLGTATTDASGNYSITYTWSSGSVTVEGVKSRFNNYTSSSFTPSGCNLTTGHSFTMSPATGSGSGYRCIDCGGASPVLETLTNTPPFGSSHSMVYATSTWSGTNVLNDRVFDDSTGCALNTKVTGDFTALWGLSVAGCALTLSVKGCSFGVTKYPVQDPGASGAYVNGGGTSVTLGTITTSPFSISYTASYTNADGTVVSGSGAITE